MKKTLIILLLVCVSLFSLTGCNKNKVKGELATEKELDKFWDKLSDIFADMSDEEVSYEFKSHEKSVAVEKSSKTESEVKVEGRIYFNYDKESKCYGYSKKVETIKGKEYTVSGKEKHSSKSTTETTLYNIIEILTSLKF